MSTSSFKSLSSVVCYMFMYMLAMPTAAYALRGFANWGLGEQPPYPYLRREAPQKSKSIRVPCVVHAHAIVHYNTISRHPASGRWSRFYWFGTS
jgi:hypothetical protein